MDEGGGNERRHKVDHDWAHTGKEQQQSMWKDTVCKHTAADCFFLMTVTHSACTGRPCSCLWPAPPRRRGVRRVWVRAPCTLCCAASRSRTCTLTTRSTRSSCRPLWEQSERRGWVLTDILKRGTKTLTKGRGEASFYRSFAHCGLISIAALAETHNCGQINHFVTPGCSWIPQSHECTRLHSVKKYWGKRSARGKYAKASLCVSWRKGLELNDKTGSKQKLEVYLYKNISLLFAGHQGLHISIKPPFPFRILQRLLSSC